MRTLLTAVPDSTGAAGTVTLIGLLVAYAEFAAPVARTRYVYVLPTSTVVSLWLAVLVLLAGLVTSGS